MIQQVKVAIADLNAAWDLLRFARLSDAEQLWLRDWKQRVAYELQVAQLPQAPPTGKENEDDSEQQPGTDDHGSHHHAPHADAESDGGRPDDDSGDHSHGADFDDAGPGDGATDDPAASGADTATDESYTPGVP